MREPRIIELVSKEVSRLWNEWEIRGLVLLSLVIQVILIIFGSQRKYRRGIWIKVIVWSSYMAADSVATVALGNLAKVLTEEYVKHSSDKKNALQAFWAPFLLLHLGGPDSITAYSLEDNELWLRHFLALFVQAAVAIYVIVRSWTSSTIPFMAIAVLVIGFTKYGERTFVLWSASTSRFKENLLATNPFEDNATKVIIEIKDESFFERKEMKGDATEGIGTKQSSHYLVEAESLYKRFRYLFANLILSLNERIHCYNIIHQKSAVDAFKLVEFELGFLYDVLYTKASFIFSKTGFCFRCFIFLSSVTGLVVFSTMVDVHQYHDPTDISVTLLLLGGAVFLEVLAFVNLCLSDWTRLYVLKKLGKPAKSPSEIKHKRWSQSMAQYNLIDFCFNDIKGMACHVHKISYVRNLLEEYWNMTWKHVSADVQEAIYSQLKGKGELIKDSYTISSIKDYLAMRGNSVLKKYRLIVEDTTKSPEDSQSRGGHEVHEEKVDKEEGDGNLKEKDDKDEGDGIHHGENDKRESDAIHQENDHEDEGDGNLKEKDDKDEGDGIHYGENDKRESDAIYQENDHEVEGDGRPQEKYDKSFWRSTTVDIEFDHSILVWHIATDILYHVDFDQKQTDQNLLGKRKISKYLSNYMLYILVACPAMLPQGIGEIKYRHTCKEVKNFLKVKQITNAFKNCKRDLRKFLFENGGIGTMDQFGSHRQPKTYDQPGTHDQSNTSNQPDGHDQSKNCDRPDSHDQSKTSVQLDVHDQSKTRDQPDAHDQSKTRVQPEAHDQSKTRDQPEAHDQSKTRDQPEAHDESKTRDQPDAHDQSKTRDQPEAHDQSKTRDQPEAHDESKTRDQPDAHDQSKTLDQPDAHDQSKTRDQLDAHDQSKTRDQPEAHDQSKTRDQPEAHDQSKTRDQPDAHDQSKTRDQPAVHDQSKTRDQPVVHDQSKTRDQPDVHDQSVLSEGCELAKALQLLESDTNWNRTRKWEMISEVWIEMLSYAAIHCGWKEHSQQLWKGGELLTHVSVLMTHFGISGQYTEREEFTFI